MNSVDDGLQSLADRRSKVERALTTLESGVIATLVGLVLLLTMTNASAMLPSLSFVAIP